MFVEGRLLHTLPEGNSIYGIAVLDNLIYLLRDKASYKISVYDTDYYRLQRRLDVPGLNSVSDMTACAHNYCLYIAGDRCIHRAALPDAADVRKWQVHDDLPGLSVTDTHSVLVTCQEDQMIKEFNTNGKLLREIELPTYFVNPQHAIQLSDGDFIVSYGETDDDPHCVCLMDSDGHVVKSYGGSRRSKRRRLDSPLRLAVDGNGFVVVVVDMDCRVLLLSPTLHYVCDVVSCEELTWTPIRVFLDVDERRLYVAENKWEDDEFTAGRVLVFSV